MTACADRKLAEIQMYWKISGEMSSGNETFLQLNRQRGIAKRFGERCFMVLSPKLLRIMHPGILFKALSAGRLQRTGPMADSVNNLTSKSGFRWRTSTATFPGFVILVLAYFSKASINNFYSSFAPLFESGRCSLFRPLLCHSPSLRYIPQLYQWSQRLRDYAPYKTLPLEL